MGNMKVDESRFAYVGGEKNWLVVVIRAVSLNLLRATSIDIIKGEVMKISWQEIVINGFLQRIL